MTKAKKILGISGSTKKDSTNGIILRYVAEHFKDELDIEIYEDIDQLPHFNPGLDKDTPPIEIQRLREKIQSADGVLICTPEYVFSLPGSLKNMIDWQVSTTLFSGKPVAIIVAAASGAKAYESLCLVMRTIESVLPDSSTLLINGARGKVSPGGEIDHVDTQKGIASVISSLLKTINTQN